MPDVQADSLGRVLYHAHNRVDGEGIAMNGLGDHGLSAVHGFYVGRVGKVLFGPPEEQAIAIAVMNDFLPDSG